jgi:penicillin-binding protein 2
MIRFKVFQISVICLFILLGLGFLNLNVLHGRKYRDLSLKNCIRLLPQLGARGKILDREGRIIVDNEVSYDCLILPQESNHQDKTLFYVSRILGVSPDNLKRAFENGYIAPSVPVTLAKNIDVKKAIALEERKIDIPGIIVQPKPLRHYRFSGLASHVIGYVSEIDRWRLTKLADYGYKTKDIVGFGGVEEKYDYYLRQEEGGLQVVVDHRGRFARMLGFRPPQNGKDVQLTLDLNIQKIVEDKLSDLKGSVIIMEPYTGEILAMASSPDFNPAVFVNKESSSVSNLINNPDAPLINRAISAAYPAGSVFKLIVAAAALETKKINSSTTFFCNGKTQIGKQEFDCWNTHGAQNLIMAIANSCNIFFYKTGILTGAKELHDYALKLGLSRPTAFELPYELSGFIPSPLWRRINKFQHWYDGDTANLSIGQGECLVTPLQMARVMAVFANNGYLVTPYIVKAIDGKDISAYQRKARYLSFKKTTVDYIKQGLRDVVKMESGTGKVLSDLSVSVAGKTGTAQVTRGQPHAWFIGYLPFNNPKFVICVFLEHAGPGYYSCLVAKHIIEAMINEGFL